MKQVTLPHLGLCGAVILCQLVNKIKTVMGLPLDSVRYWTDSSVVLAWLAALSNRWYTFVANRVAEIQDRCSVQKWRHVVGNLTLLTYSHENVVRLFLLTANCDGRAHPG